MDDVTLFDQWFRIADKDRDGRIAGPEAVEFFSRSGLDKGTLFQIWNTVAGNSAALNKAQFYSAMRLVSLAQQNNGVLLESAARLVVIGTGPVPPAPRMAGLEQPAKEPVKQWTTPAAPAGAAAPQAPAGPGAPGQFQGGATTAQQGSAGGYPPLLVPELQRYQNMFVQLDTDRDGRLQGGECYNFFLQFGLPKPVLKNVWSVVAGDQGFLSGQQFVTCLYLMECAKKGLPIPPQLPPNFPPMASGPNIVGMDASGKMTFTMPEYQAAVDVTGQTMHVAPLPPKQNFVPGPPGAEYQSRVPAVDESRLHELTAAERARVTGDRDGLMLRDQELFNVQREAEMATRKAKFYKDTLAELAMFKSKTDVSLLQAQERLSMDKTEADSLEKRYNDAYAGAQKQYEEGMRLRDAVQKAREVREEWAAKLAQLEADISQLTTMSDSIVETEESAAAELQKKVADAQVRKLALESQTDGLKQQKAKLQEELDTLQSLLSKAEAEANECQHELNTFKQQVASGSIGDGAIASLQQQLRSTAMVYRTLRDYASNLQAPIPPEAIVGPYHPDSDLDFNTFQLSAADNYWDNFKDEGFRVVNVLPADTRVSSITAGGAIAATAPAESGDSAMTTTAAKVEGTADSASSAASAAAAAGTAATAAAADTSWMTF